MNVSKILSLGLVVALLSSCAADLRTKTVKNEYNDDNITKGKNLLDAAWKAQGMDKLRDHAVYEFKGTDHWKGMLGKVGKIWPEAKGEMHFRYAVGTFDSHVKYLDGKRQGYTEGLQSWQYYDQSPDGTVTFYDKPQKRRKFGLAAYQYFFEMTDRLRHASVITYAGEREHHGKLYDQVFVTWNSPEPDMEVDQYLVLIDRTTGMASEIEYTLRENYLKAPGARVLYGSIRFSDFKDVDGVKIPMTQHVFTTSSAKKDKRYLHRMTVEDFSFDGFDKQVLYPNQELGTGGDTKPN